MKRVLLIDGECEDSRAITEMIERQGAYSFELGRVDDVSEAEGYLARNRVDVVLACGGAVGKSGGALEAEVVEVVQRVSQRASIVLLLGPDVEPREAMQHGAQDYLIKGEFDGRELMRALENAIERKSMEEAQFADRERAQITLDSIGDAVISTDAEGKITFLNQTAGRLTGWTAEEARGVPMEEVFRIVDATTRKAIANPMQIAIEQDQVGHLPGSCILIRRDGEEMFIEDSAAPIHGRDGKVTGSVIVFRDVSASRKLAEETMHASQHDFLTGLPNRLLLEDRLGQAIALAGRHKGILAVLYVDLDRFKGVNDSLGHLVGDKLLQSIAVRLQAQVRTPDTVSRQGGDEFVVVLQEVGSREGVEVVTKRILDAIAAVHVIGEYELIVTASIGVGLYPQDGMDAEALLKSADRALYQAKASGRGRFEFFEDARDGGTVLRREETVGGDR